MPVPSPLPVLTLNQREGCTDTQAAVVLTVILLHFLAHNAFCMRCSQLQLTNPVLAVQAWLCCTLPD